MIDRNKKPFALPEVSIIIPTHNCGCFISDTLESILAQTFKDYEVIIVDDGSTDNTREVVKKIKSKFDDKLKYIYQQNKGVSCARNNGIRSARGKYLNFIDADDTMDKNALNELISCLKKNDDAVLVYANVNFCDSTMTKIFCIRFGENSTRTPYSGKCADKLFLEGNFIPIGTVLVKKEAFDEVGLFDKRFRTGGDLDMWIRISYRFKIIYCDKILANIRRTGMSLRFNSSSNARISVMLIEKVMKYNSDIVRSIGKEALNNKLYNAYYSMGLTYVLHGRRRAGRKWLIKAFRIDQNILSNKIAVYYILSFLPFTFLLGKIRNRMHLIALKQKVTVSENIKKSDDQNREVKKLPDLIVKKSSLLPEKYVDQNKIRLSRIYDGVHSKVFKLDVGGMELRKEYAVKKYHNSTGSETLEMKELNNLNFLKPLFRTSEKFGIQCPADYDVSAFPFLITDYVEGEKITDLVTKSRLGIKRLTGKEELKKTFFRAGKWLHFFQDVTRSEKSCGFDREEYKRRTKNLIERCGSNGDVVFDKVKARDVRDKMLSELVLIEEDSSCVGVHNDFTPWNLVIQRSGKVFVMDLLNFAYGNRYDDLSMFAASMDAMSCDLFEKRKRIQGLISSFAEGYGFDRINISMLRLIYFRNLMRLFLWKTERKRKGFP